MLCVQDVYAVYMFVDVEEVEDNMFSILVSDFSCPIHCFCDCKDKKSAISIFNKLVKQDCYHLILIEYRSEVQK